MKGSPTSTCQANGQWSTAPACNHPGQVSGCGTPPSIASGTPVYTTTNVGDTVSYTCQEGFKSGVVSQATCQPDQTWGPDIPTCDISEHCAIGPKVLDSSSLGAPSSLWLVIFKSQFTCTGRLRRWTYFSRLGGITVHFGIFQKVNAPSGSVGFKLVGYSNVTTKGTNNYEIFDIPDDYVFNVTTGDYMGIFYPNPLGSGEIGALPTGTSANYKPYSTSDLQDAWVYPYGTSDILSTTQIQFASSSLQTNYRIFPLRASVSVPPGKCSVPPSLQNGNVTYSSLVVGNTATYSCKSGYTLIGTSTITCQTLGFWTPSVPVCEEPDLCAIGTSGNAGGTLLGTNLRIFTTMAFSCSGEIRRWKFHVKKANVKFYLTIWRKSPTVAHKFDLIGSNPYTALSTGDKVYDVALAERIQVKAGDVLGIHYDSPYFGSDNAAIALFSASSVGGYEAALGDGDIMSNSVTFASKNETNFYTPSVFASVVTSSGCVAAPKPVKGFVWQPNNSVAIYTCESGYNMVGASSATCNVAGSWPTPPKCVQAGGCSAGVSDISESSPPFTGQNAKLNIFTSLSFSCSGKIM